jgi:hypothetical protein
MTAPAARALSPAVVVVAADASAERDTVRAIADALLSASPHPGLVDTGGRVGAGGAHLAMYAEVPAKTRGAAFGERLVEVLGELGISARIGIADDRFTAWVAAAYGPVAGKSRASRVGDPVGVASGAVGMRAADDGEHASDVVAVPRGGSAAFLAPRPLSLLAITPEVQHMLEALGVRTLGEFAALPAPSVARPLESDYQALARGESGSALRPYVPDAPIREEVIVSAGNVLEAPGSLGGPAAIALIARRVALRLAGRRRGAARLEVVATAGEQTREIPVELPRGDGAVIDAERLARVLAPALAGGHEAQRGGWRLRVTVAGEAIVGEAIEAPMEAPVAPEATMHPLAVVLSSTGTLFSLSSPSLRDERREAHRRTRRGKQRRSRPASARLVGQSQLFERGSSK